MFEAKNKNFYLNGEKFIIRSGAFHYFRALPEYWEDILTKMKAAGLNTVETYTCWNLHEPHKGEYDFSGMLDLEKFIQLTEKVGLKLIVRTGPFICAEWENGGLPSWLLKRKYNIRMRCNTEPYMTHLTDWFNVLLPKIKPYLDSNGGPIIAIAVENEYGSFGDDFEYLKKVEDVYKSHGIDCLYIAADGNKKYHLCTGKSGKHIIHGIDLGGVATRDSFKIAESYDSEAPRFTTEYWAGNFTNWGFKECTNIPDEIPKQSMENFEEIGASFNLYMMYGGTNFGFTNGAQGNLSWMEHGYNPVVTSYDYDAAISEWGGYTRRYFDIKEAIEKTTGKSDTELPKSPKLQNIGTVEMTQTADFFDNLDITKAYKSVTVESMEEFDQIGGYILYTKTIDYDSEMNIIKLAGIRDRAHVYVNKKLVGIRMRGEDETVIKCDDYFKKGDVIDVLVENMGRICYGEDTYLGDRKGITEAIILTHEINGEVRSPGKVAFNWDIHCFEADNTSDIKFTDLNNKIENDNFLPKFYKGSFKTDKKESCFIHFDNLKKGIILVNGFNLGRYWERGPLKALYLPGAILNDNEANEILIFETDGLKGTPSVEINNICGIENHHEEIIID